MRKPRSQSSEPSPNFAKSERGDLGEYLLLALLVALIIGAVLFQVAHIHIP